MEESTFWSAVVPSGNDAFSPLIRNSEAWPTQERFNSILRSTAISVGAKYIDAGIENFVDWGHFSASGSRKFAALITKEVDSDCYRVTSNAAGGRSSRNLGGHEPTLERISKSQSES